MAGDPLLSEAESQAVANAVEAAERTTSGEILVVVTGECSDYRWLPLAWAAGVALIVPLVLALTALPLDALARGRGWDIGEPPSARQAVAVYGLIQAATFLLSLALLSIPAIRRALTPVAAKRRRVRQAALEQFVTRELHHTEQRNAVLIFAALRDRMVEVVADEGALAAVPQATWDGVADAVSREARRGRPAEGLVEAVRLCGEALSGPFPWREGDRNELPDRPLQV